MRRTPRRKPSSTSIANMYLDDGALVFMSGWSGIDFGQYAPTDLVKKVQTNAIISVVDHLAGGGKDWTIEELARWGGIGGLGPFLLGRRRRSRTFCRNGPKRQTLTATISPTQ